MFNELTRYQVQNPTGTYGRPIRRGAAVRKVCARFKDETGIRLTDAHGRSEKPIAFAGLEHRLTVLLQGSPLGVVTIKSDKHSAKVRKVQTRIKTVATTGNERVDEYFTALVAKFKGTYNLGALVCKTIGTTSSYSQHCNWPKLPSATARKYGFSTVADSAAGNAIDAGHHDPKVMDAMFRWAVANAAKLDIENLIHWPTTSPHPLIWNPEGGMHEYVVPPGGSDHRDHVHADFKPTRTGTPLC